MKHYSFIKVVLWDRFSIWDIFKTVKQYVLCIKYDKDNYVCLMSGRPRLVNKSKVIIHSRDIREYETYKVEAGKAWLTKQIEDKTFWDDPKTFLKAYIETINATRK